MLIAHNTRIMVIDGAHMSLFRNRGQDSALDLERIEHRESPSERTSDMGTDRPGRSFQTTDKGRSAHEVSDFHQQDEDRFSIEAAKLLGAELIGDICGILVAAPHVLGVMRKHLPREKLIAEIDKDFAQRSVSDITDMLVRYES
jgi:protein required for attachment to host cells